MEFLDQVILTDEEKKQMVSLGYRRVRLWEDGRLQVASKKVEHRIDGVLHKGWDWVDWPRPIEEQIQRLRLEEKQ